MKHHSSTLTKFDLYFEEIPFANPMGSKRLKKGNKENGKAKKTSKKDDE